MASSENCRRNIADRNIDVSDVLDFFLFWLDGLSVGSVKKQDRPNKRALCWATSPNQGLLPNLNVVPAFPKNGVSQELSGQHW